MSIGYKLGNYVRRRPAMVTIVTALVIGVSIAAYVEYEDVKRTYRETDESRRWAADGAKCDWTVRVTERQLDVLKNEGDAPVAWLTLRLQAKVPKPIVYARGKLTLGPPDGGHDFQLWDQEISERMVSGDVHTRVLGIRIDKLSFGQWIKTAPLEDIHFVVMVDGVRFADGETWASR